MKRFAVIGHPIGHSLSPLMHNTAFKLLGLDYKYELMDIEPSNLRSSIEEFRNGDWGGFNVTVPHKEAIMPFLDEVNDEAQRIGAVNTVVIQNKKMIGYNTDIIGVRQTLQAHGNKINNNRCLIIGSGGAARSVVYVLAHNFKPASITFLALYTEQALSLINSINNKLIDMKVIPIENEKIELAMKENTLIVNASPVGMHPNINESPIPNKTWFSKDHIVFDVVYKPLDTRFLKEAKSAGAITIGGLDMFIHQGAAAFKLWTDKEMPIEIIKKTLTDELLK